MKKMFRFFNVGAFVASLILGSSSLQAQIIVSDDFSSGNDSSWTHLSGYVGSTGQAWLVGGGTNIPNAYRLLAPNNGLNGYGFVGSYAGPVITDGRVEVDFVSFAGPGANPVFAVAGRLNGNNGLAALTGYGYAYEPFASSGAGEMVLYRINTGVDLTDIGSQQVSLDPAKDYKFVLEFSGSTIHGQVFEIGGGLVAERFATDATYASGFSGVLGYGNSALTPPADFTVDNFQVVPEPGVSLIMGLGLAGLMAIHRLRRKRS
jgi:hypothetical protein